MLEQKNSTLAARLAKVSKDLMELTQTVARIETGKAAKKGTKDVGKQASLVKSEDEPMFDKLKKFVKEECFPVKETNVQIQSMAQPNTWQHNYPFMFMPPQPLQPMYAPSPVVYPFFR
jgi:hypothetical protein